MDPLMHMAIRAFVAIVLAAAVAHKVADWRRFRSAVQNFAVAPAFIAPLAPMIVIALEVAALALVIAGPGRIAGIAAASLFAAYGALLARMIIDGRKSIDCGCSWVPTAVLSPAYVYRNIALAASALLLAEPASPRALVLFDYVNAAGFAVIVAGVYFLFDALLHLNSLGERR